MSESYPSPAGNDVPGSLRETTRPAAPAPAPRVDTSNLSPGAAARFEKLIRSIDSFTDAVQRRALTPPARK